MSELATVVAEMEQSITDVSGHLRFMVRTYERYGDDERARMRTHRAVVMRVYCRFNEAQKHVDRFFKENKHLNRSVVDVTWSCEVTM